MENIQVKEFIRSLREKDIRINVSKGEIILKAPKGSVDKGLLQEIKELKPLLIGYFSDFHLAKEEIKKINSSSGGYETSHAQRRLWILSQFEDESKSYNMPNVIELAGHYDINIYVKAIHAVVKRHEILRTVFKLDPAGNLKQYVLSEEEFETKIDYHDFRNEENKALKVEEIVREDTYKIFDLEKGPLFRAKLFRCEEDKYTFYYNIHHIISDDWSGRVLEKDVLRFYEIFKSGNESDFPELKIQYKDYAAWQNNQLNKKETEHDKSFWLNLLSEKIPALDLPGFKRRPNVKTNSGYYLKTIVSPEITKKINAFTQENGGSLFMFLIASWNILFHKYTGQKDIIVGTPVTGREQDDLENQIGFYINTIVLRNTIDPGKNFMEFYQDIKTNTLKCFDHQTYPFDKLVEDLNLIRNPSRNAIFDVLIKLLNTSDKVDSFEKESLETDEIVDMGFTMSKFDLNISIKERKESLELAIVFNPDVYEKELIEGLIIHFKQLVSQLVELPSKAIDEINYLPEEEKERLIYEFNNTQNIYSSGKTLVDLIKEKACTIPDKIAVIDSQKSWTYQRLNEEANRIAWCLKKSGVQKGHYICLNLSRSSELIASVLGVVKSGAAYLPFEPALPNERKIQILSELTVPVIITDSKHLNSVLELISLTKNNIKVMCVDDWDILNSAFSNEDLIIPNAEIKIQSLENPPLDLDPTDEAYTIFTSGSTGTPKGVVVQHRPVVNLIEWVNSTYGVTSDDKLLMVASISFDLSVYDIFGIINAGGTIRIASYEELQDPEKLAEIINNESITFWDSAPATLLQIMPYLLNKVSSGNNKKLRLVFLSGDWIPMSLPEDLKKCFEGVKVVALGGATEAVIWSNYYLVETLDPNWVSIPYGRPIWNAKYYILDSNLIPCPIGVAGDLYIGGEVLAKEYKNDKILTCRKFLPSPFELGARIYNTGDRARYFPDGNIEFLGRLDEQVKIRGFRIEMGDIKYVIEQHDLVKDVFVTTKGEKNDRQLLAYYTTKSQLEVPDLKFFISTKLPEYMIPAFLIKLEQFPVTINGKLDRQALPDPGEIIYEQDDQYVKPRNAIEKSIVSIWSKVLGLSEDKIGVKNSFFELGGDSLKVTLIISKIQSEFKVKIDYRQLFMEPTVENLAKHINTFQLLENQLERTVDNNNELVF